MATKNSNYKSLSSFCQDRSSFKIKFALMSFYKIEYWIGAEIFILILEYLQLMSQVILSSSTNYDNPVLNSWAFDVVVYFFKLVNPSYLLTYEKSDTVTSTVMAILLCFTLIKLGLFGYVLRGSLRNYKINTWLIYAWKWMFKLQTRVMYFILTSFWVNAIIEAKEGDFSLFGISQASLMFLSSFVLAVEFLMSFILENQFCYVLPTDSFLSSKNNELPLTTLFQKLIIQVFQMIFSSNPSACAWIASTIGLAFSGMREFQFIRKLPLYDFGALVLQRALLSIVASLYLTYFLYTILKETAYEAANINFLVFIWIIISLLSVKGGHENLRDKILSLICTSQKCNSAELLLHKVYATEQLKENEFKPNKKNLKYHWTHLVSNHQRIKILDIFGLSKTRSQDEFEMVTSQCSQEGVDKRVFLWFFEELAVNYPRDLMINLHTAFTYFRFSSLISRL